MEIVECGSRLPADVQLWRVSELGGFKLLFTVLRLVFGNLLSLFRVVLKNPGNDVVYVPYPAVFFLWWASWLPRRLRPKVRADAYVVLWDSRVRDRGHGSKGNGVLSRLLKAVEVRALNAAEVVLVDTEANRHMLVEEFRLMSGRVVSLPLAIDETLFLRATSSRVEDGHTRVLFVGTMIPLHGVDVILDAIEQLRQQKNLVFRIIGDGQLSNHVAVRLSTLTDGQVEWRRGWMGLEEIAQEIADADICLGVFSGGAKASRVLPFKLYMYMAVGKPIITQGNFSLPAGLVSPPLITIARPTGAELAQEIIKLSNDQKSMCELSRQSRAYFENHLGASQIARRWREILSP